MNEREDHRAVKPKEKLHAQVGNKSAKSIPAISLFKKKKITSVQNDIQEFYVKTDPINRMEVLLKFFEFVKFLMEKKSFLYRDFVHKR